MRPASYTTPAVFAVVALIAAAVFAVDLVLPLGVAGGVPYIAAILVAIWSATPRYTLVLAVTCSLLVVVGAALSQHEPVTWIVLTNRLLALFAIWVTVVLGLRWRRVMGVWRQERSLTEATLRALNEALEERVAERATQLQQANARLREEIAERALTEDALRKSESLTRELYEITADPEGRFEDKVQRLLASGCRHFDLEMGIVSRVSGDDYEVRYVHASDGRVRRGRRYSVSGTFCERTLASPAPVGFHHAGESEWSRHPAYDRLRLEAYLGAPVHVHGKVYGTLNFSSRTPRREPFSDHELARMRLMAQWVGYELSREAAAADLRRRDRQLVRLLHAALRIGAETSLEHVLEEVVESAREVIGCRYAALGVLDASGKRLGEFVASGLTKEESDRIGALPQGKGVLGLLITHPRPLRLADIGAHASAHGFPPGHPTMKSFLGVPIVGRYGVMGNLYLTEKLDAETFSDEDEAAAQTLAAEAAVAVENARLVAELRALQASRDRFFAMVSHELRNALTAVHGWSELLMRRAGDDPPRAMVETVESAHYALDLLQDLLDLSRLDAEKLEPRLARTEVPDVVHGAVTTVEPYAVAEGVRIEVRGVDGPISCMTDAVRVQQILVNLLRNAVRHSPEDEVVILEVGYDESSVSFAVVDRGEGISPEQQQIIFEAYSRASSTAGGGTGLGLTLSRRLARLLGGDITVQSQPGKGARFTTHIARNLPDPVSWTDDVEASQSDDPEGERASAARGS